MATFALEAEESSLALISRSRWLNAWESVSGGTPGVLAVMRCSHTAPAPSLAFRSTRSSKTTTESTNATFRATLPASSSQGSLFFLFITGYHGSSEFLLASLLCRMTLTAFLHQNLPVGVRQRQSAQHEASSTGSQLPRR